MRNIWRTYIQPFNEFGNYSGTWIEVTQDTISEALGSLSQQLDNTTFDIGILRNSGLSVQMDNKNGFYSDTGQVNSIFKFRRGGSQFKLTWEIDPEGPMTGISSIGNAYLSTETDIFRGILVDANTTIDVKSQSVTFMMLGRESLLQNIAVPSITNGTLISAVIYAILNQDAITNVLTIDQANITCELDQTIDDYTSFYGRTAFSVMSDLLAASNSVLYILNDTVYVSGRDADPVSSYTFFGESSNQGTENIIDLSNVRTGLNRVINTFLWTQTPLVSIDATSVEKYGTLASSVQYGFISDNTKRQNIMDSLLTEFKNPKLELEISTPMSYDTLAIALLSRITIDYPISYTSFTGVPICGIAVCGNAVLPRGMWAFYLDQTGHFKAISIKLDIKQAVLTFTLRLI